MIIRMLQKAASKDSNLTVALSANYLHPGKCQTCPEQKQYVCDYTPAGHMRPEPMNT